MLTDAGRRLAMIFAGVVVAGLSAGGLFGRTPAPESSAGEVDWELPEPASLARLDPEDVKVLAQAPAWRGEPEQPDENGKRVTQWKLLGVVSEGGGTALVGTGDRMTEVMRLQAGQPLPDGSRLLTVQADRVVIEQDGCRRTIRLFQGAGAARAPKCDTPAPTTDKRPGKT